jgi:uncharacterized protein YdhG (YjbR/CyaY superfamily)
LTALFNQALETTMPIKATTVDGYLAAVTPEQRAALEKLRATIRSVAPKAEECIAYGIPSYKQNGYLVGFGAGKNHCSFYPGAVVQDLKLDLKNYDLSKGTIRFQPDKPLPAALVKKIVKLRIERNLSRKK